MKKTMIMWAIISVLLILLLTTIGLNFKNRNNKYSSLENDLIESANIYVEMNNINLKVGESIKLNSSKLDQEMNVDNDECIGYVIVSKKVKDMDYKPYIKCENYETNGYE